jgi:hypothetical protein
MGANESNWTVILNYLPPYSISDQDNEEVIFALQMLVSSEYAIKKPIDVFFIS